MNEKALESFLTDLAARVTKLERRVGRLEVNHVDEVWAGATRKRLDNIELCGDNLEARVTALEVK